MTIPRFAFFKLNIKPLKNYSKYKKWTISIINFMAYINTIINILDSAFLT